MQKWNLAWIPVSEDDETDSESVEMIRQYLEDGWEPFAATTDKWGMTAWLRRPRDEKGDPSGTDDSHRMD